LKKAGEILPTDPGRRVGTMKDTKAKASKTIRGPRATKPKAEPWPAIDPVLLEEVGHFLDDPETWFHTPNAEFEGRMPIEMLGTPDEARLRNRIEAAKLGMFS
jgi:hypothetical protein